MKRPFAVIGFSMAISAICFYSFNKTAVFAVALAALTVFLFTVLTSKTEKHRLLIYCACGVMLFSASYLANQLIVSRIDDEIRKGNAEITGTVTDVSSVSDYGQTYIVKIHSLNGKKVSFKVRFFSERYSELEVGGRVEGVINASRQEDEGFFKYGLSQEVYYNCFGNEDSILTPTDGKNHIYAGLFAFKNAVNKPIDKYLPGINGALAKAMLSGDKGGIDERTLIAFNCAGTSHLLVISGLHLTLWALGFVRLLEKSRKIRKYAPILGIGLIIFYCALAGFSHSVVRAGIMTTAALFGSLTGRDSDSINSVGTAFAVILTFNPFAAYSAGLWLSALSTLGILLLNDKIYQSLFKLLPRALRKNGGFAVFILKSFAVSLSATVATLPVFVFYFDMFPVLSVLTNLVTVDAAMLMMLLAAAGAVIHYLGLGFIAEGTFLAVGELGRFLRFFTEKIGMSDFSTVPIDKKLYTDFLIFAVICILPAAALKKRAAYSYKIAVPVVIAALVFTMGFTTYREQYCPLVEIISMSEKSVAVFSVKGETAAVCDFSVKSARRAMTILNRHNAKQPDIAFVLNENTHTPSGLLYTAYLFPDADFVYPQTPKYAPCPDFGRTAKTVTLNDKMEITAEKENFKITARYDDKTLAITDIDLSEKVFENGEKYDIIILLGEYDQRRVFLCSRYLSDDNSRITVISEEESAKIYF